MARTSNSNSSENNIFETSATSSVVIPVSTESQVSNTSIVYEEDAMTESVINKENDARVDFVDREFIDFDAIQQNSSNVNKSIMERMSKNSTFRLLPDITSPYMVEPEKSSIIFDSTDNTLKYFNGTEWVDSEGQSQEETWEYLSYNWSEEPTLITAISSGDVYEYKLDESTRYRLVPNPYNPTQDAFYSDFDGTNLTNLITTRG
jgi:hypothetical protein